MADPRITYNSVNIDLKMGRTGLKQTPKQERFQNDASSGKIETINLFGRWEYSFDAYFSQAVYYTLWAWWSWARQGKEWSFALDSAKLGNTTLDAAAAAGQKVIPVTATTTFATGDVCLIKAVDNDDEFELITINTISAGVSVAAVSNLVYSYTSSDILRYKDYFPAVVISPKSFSPEYTGVVSTTGKYHRYTFEFIEAL